MRERLKLALSIVPLKGFDSDWELERATMGTTIFYKKDRVRIMNKFRYTNRLKEH